MSNLTISSIRKGDVVFIREFLFVRFVTIYYRKLPERQGRSKILKHNDIK